MESTEHYCLTKKYHEKYFPYGIKTNKETSDMISGLAIKEYGDDVIFFGYH